MNNFLLITHTVYEGYDGDGNYAAMYAFIVCEAHPDGAGLQSIPADIAAMNNYDKICAVLESDDSVVIRTGVYFVRETAEERGKRDADLPRNGEDSYNISSSQNVKISINLTKY